MAKKKTKKTKLRLMIFGTASFFVISYFCFTFASYIYNFASLKKEEQTLNNELIILQDEKQGLKNLIVKLKNGERFFKTIME